MWLKANSQKHLGRDVYVEEHGSSTTLSCLFTPVLMRTGSVVEDSELLHGTPAFFLPTRERKRIITIVSRWKNIPNVVADLTKRRTVGKTPKTLNVSGKSQYFMS